MIDRLEAFYIEHDRDEAILAMAAAIARAYDRIEAGPLAVAVYSPPRGPNRASLTSAGEGSSRTTFGSGSFRDRPTT